MNSQTATVFVVDDEVSVRKSIERVLRAAGLTVSTYASSQEYLQQFDPDIPGCLVLDLAMPGCSGLELQEALVADGCALPVIFLTGRAEIEHSVLAMKHGAIEFLIKPVCDCTLLYAIRSGLERDRIDRALRARVAEIRQRLATLTPRESEVLGHIIAGQLNKQTAFSLGTVEKTIKVHRAHIMEKMQVKSLAELVLAAVRAGLVPVHGG